jgi:uncharacterized membrane protein
VEEIESNVRDAVEFVIPIIEGIGAAVIAGGVLAAATIYLLGLLGRRPASYERVRLLLARTIALGLEFQLASDVLGTAVSPSFEQIGRLAAIAAIRTALNFFLAQEIERAERMERGGMLPPMRGDAGGPSAAAVIRPWWWPRADRRVEAGP